MASAMDTNSIVDAGRSESNESVTKGHNEVDLEFPNKYLISAEDNSTNPLWTSPIQLNIALKNSVFSEALMDKPQINKGLSVHGLLPSQIHYAVATHGHSDHLGNLNLFTNATHIVGYTVSKGDKFFMHPFETGEPYKINDDVKIIPTPGHTSTDVSIVVDTVNEGVVVIAGDLFEKQEDLADESIWKYVAGSENPETQEKHRNEVLKIADYIVPGHGPKFKVSHEMKNKYSKSSS